MAALTAVLTGTFNRPELRFEFPWGARLPNGKDATAWVKDLPGRRWDNAEKCWYLTGTGAHPDKVLAAAGITVDYSEATGDLAGLDSLEPLWRPLVAQSSAYPCNAFVRPRMAGFERVSALLGPGAAWDKTRQRFTVPLSDLLHEGALKRGLIPVTDGLHDAALERLQPADLPPEVLAAAAELAASSGCDDDNPTAPNQRTLDLIDKVAAHTGRIPEKFGLSLFPYQLAGVYAAAAGHNLIADSPGLGKCTLPSTLVLANGKYTPIGDLWAAAAEFSAPVPDADGVGEVIGLRSGQINVESLNSANISRVVGASHLYRERISAPVKTIRTASGAKITTTLPHRFLTSEGWRADIRVGDMVAVPDNTPFIPNVPWTTPELARFMAWQIGEGYEHKQSRVEITNNDEARLTSLLADIQSIAADFNIDLKGIPTIVDRGNRVPHLLLCSVTWRRWLEGRGYRFGNLAAGKSLPGFIMGARRDVQREFIANYFSAEGSFSTKSGVLEIVSASRLLMVQLQGMLARFGVAMNIADRQKCATNGSRTMRTYTVGTVTGEDVIMFRDRIGFADEVKASRLAEYRAASVSNVTRRVPCIPTVRAFIEKGIGSTNFARTGSLATTTSRLGTTPAIAAQCITALRAIGDGSLRQKHSTETGNRWTARTLEALDALDMQDVDAAIEKIENMMSPSVRWTKVTSVEYSDYEGWVYDLTVPDGHNYIAENLWCHNTRTSLAVAAVRETERLLVVCPPLVLTHWGRDIVAALGPLMPADAPPPEVASLDSKRRKKAAPKKKPEFPDWVCVIRPGRKIPDFPARGAIVIADSLLAARPELLRDLIDWAPDVVIADEVHRLSSWASARGTAVRNLVWCSGTFGIPLTGTPMRAKPVELANIMAISGHLERVFGGASRYIDKVATQNRFGAWKPRKNMLPKLGAKLNRDVWTRRNKKDVLKQLPKKWRSLLHVDIDQRGFKQAHADLYAKIAEWVDEQLDEHGFVSDEMVSAYAKESIGLMSPLRVAAGVAKVKPAIEYVKDWLEKTTDADEHGNPVYTRPLIVWAHHREVLDALRDSATEDMAAEIIDGSTPSVRRQEIADRFQAGEVGVLFASITAAGFGLTLTRSSDAVFVEQDWTPANISQAEDRIHRIGATEAVMITTLFSKETLDPSVRAVLKSKGEDLEKVLPGADNHVTRITAVLGEDGDYVEADDADDQAIASVRTEADIIRRIVEEIVDQRTATATRTRKAA